MSAGEQRYSAQTTRIWASSFFLHNSKQPLSVITPTFWKTFCFCYFSFSSPSCFHTSSVTPQYVEMLSEGCNLHSAGSKVLGKSGELLEDDCLKHPPPESNRQPRKSRQGARWNCSARPGVKIILLSVLRLDGRHVVFGNVTAGMEVVKKVESYGSRSGRTSKTISVTDCGELP